MKRRQGKLDEAIELQNRAAELDPLNQDIWVNLGRSYRGARRFNEARQMFDRALTIAPGDLDITEKKAETYLAEGDLDAAGRLLEGVEVPPNNIVFALAFYSTQVQLLLYRRQFDQALAKVSADVARAKNLPPLLIAMSHRFTGMVHSAKGDLATARPLFLQAQRELRALREQGETGLPLADTLIEVDARLGERQEVDREADALLEFRRGDAVRKIQSGDNLFNKRICRVLIEFEFAEARLELRRGRLDFVTRETDFGRVGRILKDAGFRGYVSIEHEGKALPAEAIRRSVDLLREAFAGL